MTNSTSLLGARAMLSRGTSGMAIAIAATMVAAPAFAQDAAPNDPTAQPAPTTAVDTSNDEIVVTGFRAALEKSEKLKKATPTIVESVSAEDIGKLPDVSIADSLARLPGVTAQRLEGRDQRLSIRGLGPDFGTTLLNGREQVTVGDNRGVEYDQYPSEFFKNVVVHKSASADLVAAGIAGTVDLRMLRPLEQKRTVAVQLRGQMNGQDKLNPDGERFGYRASATYVDKFANDTIGLAIGLSSTSAPSQNERYAAWGFPNDKSVGGNKILGGAKPYVQSNLLKRNGVVTTLEFEPSDRSHTTIDVLYSKFKETQRLRGIEFPINPGWGSNAVVQNYTATDGLVTDAVLTNVHAVQRNDVNKRTATNISVGINEVYKLSDTINLTVDGSWSRAKRKDFLLETYTGAGYASSGAPDTIHITANNNGTFDIVPTLDYTDRSKIFITDPAQGGWGYNGTQAIVQAGFLNQPKFKDDLKSLRVGLDGEMTGGVFSRWTVGANYSRRAKDSLFFSEFLCPKDANPDCTVAGGTAKSIPIPDAAVIGTVPLDYLGVPAMLALDPFYVYNNLLDHAFDNRPVSQVRDYDVIEKVATAYAMLNIDSTVGTMPVTGSIGLQYVHSNQESNGLALRLDKGVVTTQPASGGNKYSDLLPSLNLSFQPSDNFFIKTGIYKSIVRARMDQLRVSQEVSFDSSRLAVTDPTKSAFSSRGGNPALRPYRSWNFDLSLENYFRKGGYVALAGYYKRLSDFVDPNSSYIFDFAQLAAGLPANLKPATTLGLVSAPGNTGAGHIFGQELTVSLPFSNFSEALSGFGVFGSVAHVKSAVDYGNGNKVDIPGFSKWSGTAEAYYERQGFQAKLSYRKRSKFTAELAGLSANPEFRTAQAEGILDAQLGYSFQPGSSLEGLSVTAQAKNLTDRPFVTYQDNDPRLVREYQHYGRDYYLTLAYKF